MFMASSDFMSYEQYQLLTFLEKLPGSQLNLSEINYEYQWSSLLEQLTIAYDQVAKYSGYNENITVDFNVEDLENMVTGFLSEDRYAWEKSKKGGCEARAWLMGNDLTKAGYNTEYAIAWFPKDHTPQHHIAPIVTLNGNKYIVDPGLGKNKNGLYTEDQWKKALNMKNKYPIDIQPNNTFIPSKSSGWYPTPDGKSSFHYDSYEDLCVKYLQLL